MEKQDRPRSVHARGIHRAARGTSADASGPFDSILRSARTRREVAGPNRSEGAEASASIPSRAAPLDLITSGSSAPSASEQSAADVPGNRGRRHHSWAELIRRAFSVDVTTCERCGGKLRLISPVHPRVATRKILDHLELPSRPPPLTPAARAANFAFTLDA
jgi:hypothetical protein